MTEPRYLDLMQSEIDGENSPEETASLREYLSANAPARKLYEDLRQLSGDLNRMPVVDPPADLPASVVSSIKAHVDTAGRVRVRYKQQPGWLSVFKYAYAVAAGLILGALLTPAFIKLWRPGRSETDQLLGTIARQDAFRDSTIFRGKIEAAGVSGQIRLRRSTALLLSELDVASEQPAEVLLEYDASQLRFRALETLDGEAPSFRVSVDCVSWTQLGRSRFRILMTCLTPEIRPMHLQLLVSGRLTYDGVYPLPGLTGTQR